MQASPNQRLPDIGNQSANFSASPIIQLSKLQKALIDAIKELIEDSIKPGKVANDTFFKVFMDNISPAQRNFGANLTAGTPLGITN